MKKIKRHTYLTCCIATMFLSISLNSYAQSDDSGPVHRPLFDDGSMLAVTIEGPLKTINRKRDESEEYPGILRYTDADGAEEALDINLRVRGKFRAKKETCNFVPLRVNFKKKQTEGTPFAGQDKIKLVTDCQSSKKSYQTILLREFLAYKILNVLTDKSFSARLLQVTYVDTDNKNRSRESYAFFIEEKEHIGERIGHELLAIPKIKYSDLDPVQSNLVNVYQYFISNTDFSMVLGPKGANCCHNTVLYQEGSDPIMPIPYDFDHAGLIDAPYAYPNPKFKIKNVTSRYYRGRCANNDLLESTFQQFIDKRDEINGVVTGLEGFAEKSATRVLSFIDNFYKDISTPKNIEKKFIKKCS